MEKIAQRLAEIVKKLFGIDTEVKMNPAPGETGADFSSNVAMRIAKQAGKMPMEAAGEIADEFNKEKSKFRAEVAKPGFLNFISPNEYYLGKLADFRTDFEKNISSDEYAGKIVVTEFSDPNPFKVLHVGHLYTSVVGDSLTRLFEFGGAKVMKTNFGGDVGLHVAKTLYALMKNGAEVESLTIEQIAKNYIEGTRDYEEDEEAKREIVEINKKVYGFWKTIKDEVNLEDRIAGNEITGNEAEFGKASEEDEKLRKLYFRGRKVSYEYFEKFYSKIGLKFDKYYPESMVAELGLQKVHEGLKKGVYEESDGAVVFKGEKVGLHTRVFINSEGLPTYEAKDVGLIYSKWRDYHFDISVPITGNDIIDYMKVVLASVAEMDPELTKRTRHMTHGQVKLAGGTKMSSRKGNILGAEAVIQEVADELEKTHGSSDFRIVMAAIKYAFLKYKVGGDIVFDPKESVKMTGNSGPYLLYSVVRAKKVLEKCENRGEAGGDLDANEKKLVKKILEYPEVLNEAVKEMAPHKVAAYLFEAAQEFSAFYEKCPVAGNEREEIRAEIVEVYLKVMEHGLSLLGIETTEEM